MEFIITSTTIKDKPPIEKFVEKLKASTQAEPGVCYYEYPLTGSLEETPSIVIFDPKRGIAILDFLLVRLEEIQEVTANTWTINEIITDSPLLKIDDYGHNLLAKYLKNRVIRNKVTKTSSYLVLPYIDKEKFIKKFPNVELNSFVKILYSDYEDTNYSDLLTETLDFNDNESKIFLSIAQGVSSLNTKIAYNPNTRTTKIGDAIKALRSRIALLDMDQHKSALEIPDGPQRIRGMAGTGKTVILALKAAMLHGKYPNAKILYTFHTQSLYNQITTLITMFHSDLIGKSPNFDKLLIRHSWGGKSKEGVYSRICQRNSIPSEAFQLGTSLEKVCKSLLENKNNKLTEEFDYVLVDESQDLPPSFFQLLYATTKTPKRIIFAYDELQSLSNYKIPDTGELFGYDQTGKKRVDFSEGMYPGGIEMDHYLRVSYRNSLEVLMVAHGIGLGLYNSEGIMQIIDDKSVWESIGYEVTEGDFKPKTQVIIKRPPENSRNLVKSIYSGKENILNYKKFNSKEDELTWVANDIERLIKIENVEPHEIIVINLNKKKLEEDYRFLQVLLFDKGILSVVPGMFGFDKDQFLVEGKVTLSTVYKAKGNESGIVYVTSFDYIYDYLDFILARNMAFTSISRAMGWCNITGVGNQMDRAINEINDILTNLPEFKFYYPEEAKIIRHLSKEEQAKRYKETKKVSQAFEIFESADQKALSKTYNDMNEEEKEQFIKRFKDIIGDDDQKIV